MNTKLLSLKETEAALNLGHTKVCELIADGDIESIKVGRRRLITPEAIDRFIERMAAGEPTVSELRKKSVRSEPSYSARKQNCKSGASTNNGSKGVNPWKSQDKESSRDTTEIKHWKRRSISAKAGGELEAIQK